MLSRIIVCFSWFVDSPSVPWRYLGGVTRCLNGAHSNQVGTRRARGLREAQEGVVDDITRLHGRLSR